VLIVELHHYDLVILFSLSTHLKLNMLNMVTMIGENWPMLQMNRLSLRINWLKFTIAGKLPINLEEFVEYTPI